MPQRRVWCCGGDCLKVHAEITHLGARTGLLADVVSFIAVIAGAACSAGHCLLLGLPAVLRGSPRKAGGHQAACVAEYSAGAEARLQQAQCALLFE